MDRTAGLLRIASDRGLRDELGPTLGPFCHQFRNRLNSIKLATYLARRQTEGDLRAIWEALEGDYREIEDRLDRIQQVCRDSDLLRIAIDLTLLFDDRTAAWSATLGQGGARLILDAPRDGCPTRVDLARLAPSLDDLVCWRAAARSEPREVCISWVRRDGRTTIHWQESHTEPDSTENDGAEPGRTWALPTLARVMADHDGSLSVGQGVGWEITMEWPDANHPSG